MKNNVQLIGHLGGNPEIKVLDGGRKMARINVATSETYTNTQGEKVKETQWHNIVAWGNTATLAERIFSKGMKVMIDGKLINRSYMDKEGQKKYVTEVEAHGLMLFVKKS